MKPEGENLVESAMQIKIPLQKQGNGMVAAVTRSRLQFFVPCNDDCGGGGGVEGADKMGSIQNKAFKMPSKQSD